MMCVCQHVFNSALPNWNEALRLYEHKNSCVPMFLGLLSVFIQGGLGREGGGTVLKLNGTEGPRASKSKLDEISHTERACFCVRDF